MSEQFPYASETGCKRWYLNAREAVDLLPCGRCPICRTRANDTVETRRRAEAAAEPCPQCGERPRAVQMMVDPGHVAYWSMRCDVCSFIVGARALVDAIAGWNVAREVWR